MNEQPNDEDVRAEPEGGAAEPDEAREVPEPPSAEVTAETAEGDEAREVLEPPSAEATAETAQEFVTGLLKAMGLDAEVVGTVEGDSAFIDVTGESLGVLIGRRGQTLDALQEITRTAVQRRLRARVRLVVDVEGYRARRRASLADYGREMAERAKERGTEIELEPMNSFERKVVHDAVAEVEGAVSFSEGEEPNRKVIIRGE